MKAFAFALLLVATMPGVLGCGASTMHVASLEEVERVRDTDDARSAATLAYEVNARAEQEREYARVAHARGDDVAANLHAERAIAAYGHARAVSRLATAIADLADSQKSLDDVTTQEQALAASRAKLELDAQELERRVRLAREKLLPAASSEAIANRDAARAAAARSLAIEARLLCGAAHLVSANAAGLADAQGDVEALDAKLTPPASPSPKPAADHPPIDDAGAARARCLEVLTRARRAARHEDGRSDALLAELSASGGWDPTRDERGVVVPVRGAFAGTKLTAEGEAKFENLGRVAAAHPGVALQVVVHDAQAPAARDESDARRAEAAAKALVAGGAPAAHLETERAGVRAPVVDPKDGRLRGRNERVDVVFVSDG